ncbi:uncharacterized protein ACR2FA_009502 [Aphomia sociella]
METCVRGFSFMPEAKVDVMDSQYIEGGELQRAWKTTRRERTKQQEQKIWEEFVKEQDVLKTVYKDDPYQFLDQLPEECLKELLDIELQKMKKEKEEEDAKDVQLQSEDESHPQEDTNQHVVTFVENAEKEDCEMFHIFDDDRDDESGPEDEVYNESIGSPSTVREKPIDDLSPGSQQHTPDKISSKSSENVTNVIENTIYCARVKDIRIKITEELQSIIDTLEQHNIMNIEPEDIVKMQRRSTEFCSRFNRIHMYQLQRQVQDVKRNNTQTLPYAKHTQFQSQMVRIVSLHQNLLQSFQVFHKSLQQAGAASAAANVLQALLRLTRELPPPSQPTHPGQTTLSPARCLYDDDVPSTCDKVEVAMNEYSSKMSEYIKSTKNTKTSHSRKAKKSVGKKKSHGTWSKSGAKSMTETEARLSMYSLDTLRINLNPKSSSSKDNQSSGTSKTRAGVSSAARNKKPELQPPPKSHRKSPRSRRPLMRDPQSGRAKRKVPRDTDIQTMVEAVGTCTSSHISREQSPNTPTSRGTPRRFSKDTTPRSTRTNQTTPRKLQTSSPLNRLPTQCPKAKNRRSSPTNPNRQKVNANGIKSNIQDTKEISHVQISPVSKIDCSKKERKQEHEDVKVDVKIVDSPRPMPKAEKALQVEKKSERDRNKYTVRSTEI